MPLRSPLYEYDYDDTRSVGRFVPPRRSVLPRNGVGFACLPRKIDRSWRSFPFNESFKRLPLRHHLPSIPTRDVQIGIFASWLQNLIIKILQYNYLKKKLLKIF